MTRLRLTEVEVIRTDAGPRLIDIARHQLVPDTPEERVRQSVLLALRHEYSYPSESLMSEELVARGTLDKRRADVLVVLPTGDVQREPCVSEPRESPRAAEPLYSEMLRVAQEAGPNDDSLQFVRVPDRLDLTVDGAVVPCRTLGFAMTDAGHGLALAPEVPLPGLPPVLGLLISGYGVVGQELEVAQVLQIDPLQWNREDTLALLEATYPLDGGDVLGRLFLEGTLLSDGEAGYAIFYGPFEHRFGLLVRLGPLGQGSAEAPEDDIHHGSEPSPPVHGEPDARELQANVRSSRAGTAVVAVVECKAPGVTLSQQVYDQALAYARTLKSTFFATTNGLDSRAYSIGVDGVVVEIEDLPEYPALLSDDRIHVRAKPSAASHQALPPDASSRPDCVRFHARFRSVVGTSTHTDLWLPILAFHDVLAGGSDLVPAPFAVHGVRLVRDLGRNVHDPGSPVGASWPGVFRDLLVETASGSRVIVGLSIQGAQTQVERRRADGVVRSPSGWTYLIVGVSDDATYETALMLPLDKNLRRVDGRWQLTHTGALTAGKGAVKREVVLDALRTNAPDLVRGNAVYLGALPNELPLPSVAVRDLLGRVVRYALVRTTVKEEVKQTRKLARRG